jgi:hypothetical protein
MARKATIAKGEPGPSWAIRIVEADLSLPAHQQPVLAMADAHSKDAVGDGKPVDWMEKVSDEQYQAK